MLAIILFQILLQVYISLKAKNSIVISNIRVIKKGYVAVISDVAFFSITIFIIFAQNKR